MGAEMFWVGINVFMLCEAGIDAGFVGTACGGGGGGGGGRRFGWILVDMGVVRQLDMLEPNTVEEDAIGMAFCCASEDEGVMT